MRRFLELVITNDLDSGFTGKSVFLADDKTVVWLAVQGLIRNIKSFERANQIQQLNPVKAQKSNIVCLGGNL